MLVGLALALSISFYNDLTIDQLQVWVIEYRWIVFTCYLLIISLRGLLLLPTSPVIIMMIALIPSWQAFILTLIGSGLSATLVVFAVKDFGLATQLNKSRWLPLRFAHYWMVKFGVPVIAAWAFFPFVFTEFIVYLAAITRLSKRSIVIATIIGEAGLIWLLILMVELGQQQWG